MISEDEKSCILAVVDEAVPYLAQALWDKRRVDESVDSHKAAKGLLIDLCHALRAAEREKCKP